MPLGAVVDANSIAVYQHERIFEQVGVATTAINHIFSVGHIVMDEANFIREQWYATASGIGSDANLLDWIADRMQENKIRLAPCPKNTPLNKALRELGMELSDRMYVFTAVSGAAKMIVTEDIDFHDPTKKRVSHAEKIKIRKTRCGPICQFLADKLAIYVGSLEEVAGVLV